MEDNGSISYGDPARPPTARPAMGWAFAGLAAVGIAMVVVLGGFRATGGADAPEATIPPLGPDLAESGRLVVEEFATAWNEGDATAAAGLIADDWERILLPGFADPLFSQRDGRPELDRAIDFLIQVSSVALGPCDAFVAPPDARASAVVVCESAGFEGPYLDALAVDVWADQRPPSAPVGIDGMVFEIGNGRILGIETDTTRFTPQAYCMWAESRMEESADLLFNLRCHPSTDPSDAGFHADAAARFLEAGAPMPGRPDAFYRSIAGFVDQFVEYHNAGAVADMRRWLVGSDVDPGAFPGFAGGTPDSLGDYLEWSTRLLSIELGECRVAVGSSATTVTCPDLSVTGPWPGGQIAQPTVFVLDHPTGSRGGRARGWITAIERLAEPAPLDGTCAALYGSSWGDAAFDADCNPIYRRAGAEALLEHLGRTR